MPKNLQAMVTRIANELDRPLSDLAVDNATTFQTEIINAIRDAISDYEAQRFFFNDSDASALIPHPSIALVAGTEYYNFPTDAVGGTKLLEPHRDGVRVNSNGRWNYVQPVAWDEIEREQYEVTPTYKSWPRLYAIRNERIRVYPVPDQAYTLRLPGVVEFEEVSALTGGDGSDTKAVNPWLNVAEIMIRCNAKARLCRHVLYQPELIPNFERDEQMVFLGLQQQTNKSQSYKRIGSAWNQP